MGGAEAKEVTGKGLLILHGDPKPEAWQAGPGLAEHCLGATTSLISPRSRL